MEKNINITFFSFIQKTRVPNVEFNYQGFIAGNKQIWQSRSIKEVAPKIH